MSKTDKDDLEILKEVLKILENSLPTEVPKSEF